MKFIRIFLLLVLGTLVSWQAMSCGSNACEDAADIICGCADIDCPSGDGDGDGEAQCDGAAETAAQCIVDNETDVCTYFADLAEDPAQTVADDYENGYADNCL